APPGPASPDHGPSPGRGPVDGRPTSPSSGLPCKRKSSVIASGAPGAFGASCELRAADELQTSDVLQNFNTKFDLAKALEEGGDPQEAYVVLTAALDEIEAPDLLPSLLRALAQVAESTSQAMPPRAEAALNRAKQFYGLAHPPER